MWFTLPWQLVIERVRQRVFWLLTSFGIYNEWLRPQCLHALSQKQSSYIDEDKGTQRVWGLEDLVFIVGLHAIHYKNSHLTITMFIHHKRLDWVAMGWVGFGLAYCIRGDLPNSIRIYSSHSLPPSDREKM